MPSAAAPAYDVADAILSRIIPVGGGSSKRLRYHADLGKRCAPPPTTTTITTVFGAYHHCGGGGGRRRSISNSAVAALLLLCIEQEAEGDRFGCTNDEACGGRF